MGCMCDDKYMVCVVGVGVLVCGWCDWCMWCGYGGMFVNGFGFIGFVGV